MKILYGVQGTGNGHLTRARALAPALKKAGIEVDFIFSGRDKEDFFNMNTFQNFKFFQGLTFVTKRGQLKPFKTLQQSNPIQFIKDVKSLDLSAYSLVISDFEPVTAWAARLKGKPSISISHQSAFKYRIPKIKGGFIAQLLMKIFAPTDYHLGLHWHPFNQAILPPLIEPLKPKVITPNKILVYMGFEAVEDIIKFLKPFDNYQFHVYAKIEQTIDLGHITVEPLSHENFHQDLCDTSGVISNAGFELASECISLGKKLLIKPLNGQYEQLCNALALQAMKRGTIIKKLDQTVLEQWLKLPPEKPAAYPDVATAIAEWIIAGDFNQLEPLAEKLWLETAHPTTLDNQYCRHIINGLVN